MSRRVAANNWQVLIFSLCLDHFPHTVPSYSFSHFSVSSGANMRRIRLFLCFGVTLLMAVIVAMVVLAAFFPDAWYSVKGVLLNQEFRDNHPEGYWAHQLKDKDPQHREEAVRELNSMGDQAKGSVAELASALSDPEDIVRILAALSLSKIGPDASEAVGALGKALSDRHPQVRMNSALALTKIGAGAAPALPQLIAALQATENQQVVRPFYHSVRQQVAMALANFGPGAHDAVPALIDALSDSLFGTRHKAAYALGQIGPGAVAARDPLLAALRDDNKDVRDEAGRALKLICPTDPEVSKLP
jgi:hypothetical protein